MKRLTADNDLTGYYPALPHDGAAPGRIYAANDSNFDAAHLSEPLTEYIVGVEDDDGLLRILQAAAPEIPVARAFTYRRHDEKESFQQDASDNKDIREIGGDFALVRPTGEQVDGRTDNKGLTMVLDNDQGGDLPAVQQRAVINLRNRLLRSELYRLEALLEANDTEDSKNWGATNTTADPDLDVINNVDQSGDARGVDANIVLFGGGARVKRLAALRRSASSGAFATGAMTPEELAGFYGVDSVVTSKFRFQSNATTKSKIIADKVYIYYAGRNLMPNDPSNVKRFVTHTDAGLFRVYVEQRLKQTLVSVEHYSRIVVTSSLGIRKIAVTFT